MLADALSRLFETPLEVSDVTPLGGGSISEVFRVHIRSDDASAWADLSRLHGGRPHAQLVIKRNSAEMIANFRCEAAGLRAMAESGVIRVPRVFAVDVVGNHAFLAMELIQTGQRCAAGDRFSNFGRSLARFHQSTAGKQIGWSDDNFLGSARQTNTACGSWPEFVATQRIGFQIRWASEQGLADRQLKSDCDKIISQIDLLLSGRSDGTSLLHGDLWSGNYLFDSGGAPVLIDPAVYRGCREAEWGMIKWLGNCPAEFERGYRDQWPMAEGWQRRVGVYQLYHQLNHLNLFGSSYADTCRRTAREVLRSE